MQVLLGKRIWLEPISPAVTESGIILESVQLEKFDKARPEKGIIKFIGKDVTENLSIGDTVKFNKMAGKEIPYLGVTYLQIHEQDVEGVLS